jgi:hypothetical protein
MVCNEWLTHIHTILNYIIDTKIIGHTTGKTAESDAQLPEINIMN